jgi:hypothetical protein
MAKLIETDEWTRLVEGLARGGNADFRPVWKLQKKEDFADLAALVLGEPGNSRDAALQVLFSLCMQNNPNVRAADFQHLCPALKEYVTAGYPANRLSQSAWTFWRKIDSDTAAQYLREWVKKNGIPEAHAARVACDLTFGNEASMAMVRSYAQAHPEVALGKSVEMALDRTAPDWAEKLKRCGREWRDKREKQMLVYLTTQVIDREPYVPIPVSTILAVMGEPDSLVDRCYTYFSRDEGRQSGCLFLEADKDGRVTGWQLD